MVLTNGVSDFFSKRKRAFTSRVKALFLLFIGDLFLTALAEILSKKELPSGGTQYYVHYIDCE